MASNTKLCRICDKVLYAGNDLNKIIIVGNTVMHHLFCGVNIAPLAGHPFAPQQPGRFRFSPVQLGWDLPEKTVVEFLPCIGGFVGSDILAGIVAAGLHESPELMALMDLGTNGEVVVGNRERLLCTSTAAGPAFEGARISMGMPQPPAPSAKCACRMARSPAASSAVARPADCAAADWWTRWRRD